MTDTEFLIMEQGREPTPSELHDFKERVGIKTDSGIHETLARRQSLVGE